MNLVNIYARSASGIAGSTSDNSIVDISNLIAVLLVGFCSTSEATCSCIASSVKSELACFILTTSSTKLSTRLR